MSALTRSHPACRVSPRVEVSSDGHGAAMFHDLGDPFADGFRSGDAITWSATVP
jgi:hypothetical protein